MQTKLERRHLDLSSWAAMNVPMAAQTLNGSVTLAIVRHGSICIPYTPRPAAQDELTQRDWLEATYWQKLHEKGACRLGQACELATAEFTCKWNELFDILNSPLAYTASDSRGEAHPGSSCGGAIGKRARLLQLLDFFTTGALF